MRIFERVTLPIPVPAILTDGTNEQAVSLKDISIDGVCFTMHEACHVDLDAELNLKFEVGLPKRQSISMKLLIVNKKHPSYHSMWNPEIEKYGINLAQWMKRLLGGENKLYTYF